MIKVGRLTVRGDFKATNVELTKLFGSVLTEAELKELQKKVNPPKKKKKDATKGLEQED